MFFLFYFYNYFHNVFHKPFSAGTSKFTFQVSNFFVAILALLFGGSCHKGSEKTYPDHVQDITLAFETISKIL